jgi:hypothetical protein
MAWEPLKLAKSASAHLPPLLFSATFDRDSSYTIYLTDLTHIWGESLSRKQIIRRSQEEKTSIDPSDDEDNLRQLLEKIKAGLMGEKNTAAALTINADNDRPSLTLSLMVKLPAGIAPLEWPVQLPAAPQTALTQRLILPLLEAQHTRLLETASLVEVLREKDHVIQKLLDRLEAQGTEFGDLFPQAAGKAGRKIDRRKAEERVKGLALFDVRTWRLGNQLDTSNDTRALISQVFQSGANPNVEIRPKSDTDFEGTWWEDIKGLTVFLDTGKIKTALGNWKSQGSKSPTKIHTASFTGISQRDEDLTQQSGDSGDGDFQVQSTPPHLKANPVLQSTVVDSSTDSDEDDLDAPSQRSEAPDSYPVSPQTSRLSPRAVGKVKQKRQGLVVDKHSASGSATDEVSSSPGDDVRATNTSEGGPSSGKRTIPKLPPATPVDASSTEDEDEPLPVAFPKRPDPPKEASTTPPKPKGRGIGKLGGRRHPKESSPSPPHEDSPEPIKKKAKLGKLGGKKVVAPKDDTSEESAAEETPKKKKLGVIGGRKRESLSPIASVPDTTEDVVIRGRSKTASKVEKEKTPEVRETSQERADNKRAALKRELEAKAKAPPVKKKRKF